MSIMRGGGGGDGMGCLKVYYRKVRFIIKRIDHLVKITLLWCQIDQSRIIYKSFNTYIHIKKINKRYSRFCREFILPILKLISC